MFIVALLIVGLVTTWNMALLTRAVLEQQTSGRALNVVRAFHLSEAGLDAALRQLQDDSSYTGTNATELGSSSGGYSIGVTPLDPSLRQVVVTGWYPANDPQAFGYASRTVEVVVQLGEQPGPGNGVFGDLSVRFDGGGGDEAQLDSYDSRQGPYTPEQARANVRLRTNSNEEGVIALVGGVAIKGDVVLGPGSDPETALQQTPKDWSSITGSVSVAASAVSLEPVTMPSLSDEGSLHIAGHEIVTLPGGLHRFRDLHISGHGQLIFTGPAEVYVEEDVHIAGNGISTSADSPPNLSLYVGGARVEVGGDANLFAKIVAPQATIDFSGNGDLYGAVSGREIAVRGHGHIHYDEALNIYDVALNPPKEDHPLEARVLSWREVDP